MNAAAVPTTRILAPTLPVNRVVVSRLAVITALVATLVTLAFAVRADGLSTYGFSEDEINKVRAIEQYKHAELWANAEHPMLMKLAMFTSVEIADAWNHVAPAAHAIAPEAALRLPNALVGAAITAVIFAVCEVLFGTEVAIIAALFWAFDVNAIAINRIGKEDTFALFFFLLAVLCYERGKRQGTTDPRGAQRFYGASGACFGLMLASKYFPHYLGVYALLNICTDRNPGRNRPDKLLYYGLMAVAFLVANVAVLEPATWRYVISYLRHDTVLHHGYAFAGHLYANTSLIDRDGVPASFYLRMLATKVPVVVLGALVPGLIETVRRRRERGFLLLMLWLGLFLLGYSFVSVKFLRYALPLFAATDILAAVGVVAGIRWLLGKRWLLPTTRIAAAGAALTACIAGPVLAQRDGAPFNSLFRNAIGEHLAPAGATFPEETYDYGVREAVASIAQVAEPGAAIVSDAPGVVAYYVEQSGRTDLRVRSLSSEGTANDGRTSFVIVQAEHLTFENRDMVSRLQRASPPWRDVHAGDALALQIFRVTRS